MQADTKPHLSSAQRRNAQPRKRRYEPEPPTSSQPKKGRRKVKRRKVAHANKEDGVGEALTRIKHALPPKPLMPQGAKAFAMASENSARSPLLRLPAELRNQVYEHALIDIHVKHAPRSITRRGRPRAVAWDGYPEAPPLLLVCTQVHDEFDPILRAAVAELDVPSRYGYRTEEHKLKARRLAKQIRGRLGEEWLKSYFPDS